MGANKLSDYVQTFIPGIGISDFDNLKTEVNEIKDDVKVIEQIADNALPKSGGDVTGSITFKNNNTPISFESESKNIGRLSFNKENEQVGMTLSARYRDEDSEIYNDIYLIAKKDGSRYFYIHDPEENTYNNQTDTLRSSINRHPIKGLINGKVYINSEIGSDAEDLYMGRGFSPDKPFKSFEAAFNHINLNYNNFVNIIYFLQTDIDIDIIYLCCGTSCNRQLIYPADSNNPPTITLKRDLYIAKGAYQIYGVNINMDSYKLILEGGFSYDTHLLLNPNKIFGNNLQIKVSNSSLRILNNIEFSGKAALEGVIYSTDNGFVNIQSSTLLGDVTGKRYSCSNGGKIITNGKGPNFIPGTVAGTCDEISTYL